MQCAGGTSERAAYRRVGESEHGLRSDPVNCEELSSMQVGPVREQAYRRVGESEHGLRSKPVNCEKLNSVIVGRAQ